ncbi:phage tail protein, P2 family [Campylobacter lari]|uniref:phage tail protein I n=1 Tax=Campylobacter TaxID=194 RepID=UPI0012D1FC59|nr:phage tail protein I [Campylobacter lari]EAK9998208.1 phage tail protein I [Campylobacter lari]MBT0828387.1 phage tail protein I [Campylobacter lari]MCR6535934.1 phage tail protein I [Campylobacter lari]
MSNLVLNHHPKQSKAIDLSAKARFEDLNLASITNLAQHCDERLLPILANAYDVSIDGLSQKEARALLSKALMLKRHAGTTYAIKESLKAVFDTALVEEWFNYDGKPYHFKVKVTSSHKPFDENTFKQLEKLIYEYKNVRSVLESIELQVQSNCDKYNASANFTIENISVLPLRVRQRQAKLSSFNAIAVFISEKNIQSGVVL